MDDDEIPFDLWLDMFDETIIEAQTGEPITVVSEMIRHLAMRQYFAALRDEDQQERINQDCSD